MNYENEPGWSENVKWRSVRIVSNGDAGEFRLSVSGRVDAMEEMENELLPYSLK